MVRVRVSGWARVMVRVGLRLGTSMHCANMFCTLQVPIVNIMSLAPLEVV